MGIILTLTMTLFTAVAIVREREHGNLELLINTPVTNTQLMVGKLLPYIVIGLILLPSILLSGFMFPFDGMPKLAQYLGEILPNTHFIRLTRGIMLRGANLFELRNELFVLLGFTIVAMTLAIKRFSRQLD